MSDIVLPSLAIDGGASAEDLLSREWLVTNGLGGYASGTVLGPNTRKYHGLLVANLPAPAGRHVVLSMVSERVATHGFDVELSGWQSSEGPIVGDVAKHLKRFRLEGTVPVWEFAVGPVTLTRRIALVHGRDLVAIQYSVAGLAASDAAPMRLRLRPYVAFRRHEQEPDETARQRTEGRVTLHDQAGPQVWLQLRDSTLALRLRLLGADASFTIRDDSLRQHYALEAARGYLAHGADYSPGYFEIELRTDASFTLVGTIESLDLATLDVPSLFEAERERSQSLLDRAGVPSDPTVARLVLAADQFIVSPGSRTEEALRAESAGRLVRTVIAGYHWFGDWGRDTMISLEGLTLCTGRASEAAAILRTFAGYVQDGLIPNLFPEGSRAALYHTVDATLWMFHAIGRYVQWSGDLALVQELLPTLESIIDHYWRGTRFGIGADPKDGLIQASAPGYQLTWMDAKAGDWVVTPRRGKPVEIQALWFNALQLMAAWCQALGRSPGDYLAWASGVKAAFDERFWYAPGGHLYDVVDGEQGDDASGRPNQVLALSLEHPVLDASRWRPVMDWVRRELLTPYGLRTLDRGHPDYRANYHGDLLSRDGAYHQGTVWPWLMGPFVDAEARLAAHEGRIPDRRVLEAFAPHLAEYGVGTLGEIFDAEAPYHPRGCIAQAWSVAEVLRAWLKLSASSPTAAPTASPASARPS